jgi:dihydroorotate dehydrogenase (NAD+) catalytic subunit
VEAAGATAISLINSLPGLAVDHMTLKPLLGHGAGGLSGPPIKPLALRQVRLASQSVKIPVVGLGGIMGFTDALEFILCGAAAVQIATGLLVNPLAGLEIIKDLEEYINRTGRGLAALRGGLKFEAVTSKPPVTSPSAPPDSDPQHH